MLERKTLSKDNTLVIGIDPAGPDSEHTTIAFGYRTACGRGGVRLAYLGCSWGAFRRKEKRAHNRYRKLLSKNYRRAASQ